MTNKIFEGFLCRELGEHGDDPSAVLEVDYSLDCESSEYTVVVMACSLLVLLWPIGLPTLLLYSLYNARTSIMEEDPDALRKFNFILGDYDKEHWYWEIIEFWRKLLLAGLIALVGRGTISQAVLATLISFLFFAAVIREMPFNAERLNFINRH